MSESDSFINEVTEEVRRDKIFGLMRKWAWLAVLIVVLLVAGAAWNEYRKGQATARAEASGDALLAALQNDDPADRLTALEGIGPQEEAPAVTALILGSAQQEAGELDAARATFGAVATNPELPAIYRDLAAFKAALLPSDDIAAQRAALEALANPGAPFRLLAVEQLALLDIAEGEEDEAVARLQRMIQDAEVTRGQIERASALIVALGGDIVAEE